MASAAASAAALCDAVRSNFFRFNLAILPILALFFGDGFDLVFVKGAAFFFALPGLTFSSPVLIVGTFGTLFVTAPASTLNALDVNFCP